MFKCNEYFDAKIKSLTFRTTGKRFGVPSDSAFDVRVLTASAYFCLYG